MQSRIVTGARRAPRGGAAIISLGVALSAVLTTAPVAAQYGLSFHGGYGGFAGSDFSDIPAGPTVAGAIHVPWEEREAEVSVGMAYSRFGAYGIVGPTVQFDYAAAIRKEVSRWPGLLGGIKVGYSTRSLSVVDDPARTDGFLIGPTFSFRSPTGLGPLLELSLDAVYATYEELIMYGGREYGTDQDGLRLLLSAGVYLPLSGG